MKKTQLFTLLFAVLVVGGFVAYQQYAKEYDYDGVHYKNGVPQGSSDQAKKNTANAEMKDWKTYRNAALGIEFQYPARFSEVPASVSWWHYERGTPTLAAWKNGRSSSTLPDEFIVMTRYETPSRKTFESVLLERTVFGASGLSPTSLSQFTKKQIGGREFYSTQIERFEGVLSFAYYLPTPSYVYRFNSIAQGVDWTNPKLDVENDPTHAALRELLATLTIIPSTSSGLEFRGTSDNSGVLQSTKQFPEVFVEIYKNKILVRKVSIPDASSIPSFFAISPDKKFVAFPVGRPGGTCVGVESPAVLDITTFTRTELNSTGRRALSYNLESIQRVEGIEWVSPHAFEVIFRLGDMKSGCTKEELVVREQYEVKL